MEMNYDKRNGNIAFRDSDHKYMDLTDPGKKFISVTTLIGKYEQPFLKDFWSSYKSIERLMAKDKWAIERKVLMGTKKIDDETIDMYGIDKNEFNAVKQSILDEWAKANRESCDLGTRIHSEIENSFYNHPKDISVERFGIGGKFECKKDYTELDLEYGVFPEYLIHYSTPDGKLNIAGQIDLLIKSHDVIDLVDHKGLPLGTPILTTNGWSTMADLKIGDKVFDKDGNECSIIEKSKIHNNPCFKILFDNSEEIIADIDHRWLISFKHYKSSKYPDGYEHVIMTTKEIKDFMDKRKNITQKNIPKILNAKPINREKSDLPIDPYVLGVWLGDGSSRCGTITQFKNSPIWEEIRSRGYSVGENTVHNPNRGNVETRNVYGLMTTLRKNGLLNNKHIPECYMLASYEQRLDLLRGLMDTDGSFNKIRKRYVMNTSHQWQAYDLRKLLATLGIKSTVMEVVNTCCGKVFPGYNLLFSTNLFNPFLIRNQHISNPMQIDKNTFRNIKSITETETIPTQCIMVDSPTHTYLAGESLIVTHNTNKKLEKKSYFDKSTGMSKRMQYPLNNLDDTNFWHYTLQLSMYAYMLEQLNPDFEIRNLILNHYDHNGNNDIYHCDYLKDDVIRMINHYKKQLELEEGRKKRQKREY